jgi:hypothetical protein
MEASFYDDGGGCRWPPAGRATCAACAEHAETLGAMHQTGSTADWPEIPQTRRKRIRSNESKIKPPGFHISPRWCRRPHIAVGPQGVTFVGTRKSKVWVVTECGRGGVRRVKEFAPTLPKIPNGVCFEGRLLYIAEQTGCWKCGGRVLL